MGSEPRIAVIGAGGFIGNRIVEWLHLGGVGYVRPIVRRTSALAMASRFELEGRVADGFDTAALTQALRGCEIVIHALAGDRRTITGTVTPAYRAAERAGCRRLIYLSSAMVHGQAPGPGTTEQSAFPRRYAIAYNSSKARAEGRLFRLRRRGRVEVVALRPGIVYGPRSQWIGGVADDMLASRAFLVEGGTGLCNAIYVDNLVAAILRACESSAVDGEAFLLGEPGLLTWRDLYARVAETLGRSLEDVPTVSFEERRASMKDRIDVVRRSRSVKFVLKALPRPIRDGLAGFWAAAGALPAPPPPGPAPTLEMALLHTSQHVPSWEKARTQLGYEPPVPPEEAWRRTLSWLEFAHYPLAGGGDG